MEVEKKDQLEDWAGDHGKGYYIETYQLSDNTIEAFKNNASKRLPDNDDLSWKKVEWRKVPVDSSCREALSVVVDYQATERKIGIYINEIKKVLELKEAFYSFYYKPDIENPNHVQFFILDIQGKKLYAVDSKV